VTKAKQWYVSNGNGKVVLLTKVKIVAEAFAEGYGKKPKPWRPKQPR
jgi:hypothetical protein